MVSDKCFNKHPWSQVDLVDEDIECIFSGTDTHTLVTFTLRVMELQLPSMHTLIGAGRKVSHCHEHLNTVIHSPTRALTDTQFLTYTYAHSFVRLHTLLKPLSL